MKYLLILSVFFQQIIFTSEKIYSFKDALIDNRLVKNYRFHNALDQNTANENHGIITAFKTISELSSQFNEFIWNDEKVKNCFKHYFITYHKPEKIINIITNQECAFKMRPLSDDTYFKLALIDSLLASSIVGYLDVRNKTSYFRTYTKGTVIGIIQGYLAIKKMNWLPNAASAILGYRNYKNINTEIDNFFDKIKTSDFCYDIFYDLYAKDIVKPSKLYKEAFYNGINDSEIIISTPVGDLIFDNKNAYTHILDENILGLNINFLTPKNREEINIDFDCIINIDVPEINQNGYLFDTYKNTAERMAEIILNEIKDRKNVLINIVSKKFYTPTTQKHELSILLLYIAGLVNEHHPVQISQTDFFSRLDLQRLFHQHPLNVQLIQYFQNIRTHLTYDFHEDSVALNNNLLNIAQNLPVTHQNRNEILNMLQNY